MAAELERNPLWLILVETVYALPMYPSHKAYVRDSLLLEQPEITVEELSQRLDIPLGEAMVILQEIGQERKDTITDEKENDT
jgi:hypothetical protein